jgi:hypothetical protein
VRVVVHLSSLVSELFLVPMVCVPFWTDFLDGFFQGHVREVGKLAYLRQTQRLLWNFGKTSRGLQKKVITNLSFQADEDLPTYSY